MTIIIGNLVTFHPSLVELQVSNLDVYELEIDERKCFVPSFNKKIYYQNICKPMIYLGEVDGPSNFDETKAQIHPDYAKFIKNHCTLHRLLYQGKVYGLFTPIKPKRRFYNVNLDDINQILTPVFTSEEFESVRKLTKIHV